MVKIYKTSNASILLHKKFLRYEEILTYLKQLQKIFPKNARTEIIGKSLYDRPIYMIVLGKNICTKCKCATFIDGNIHAREWLANSTIIYFIDHLIRNKQFLDGMDYYIVPCLNPDGYEYTHTVNRLWRKNLNKNNAKNEIDWGVDLNRNFPFQYGLEGSSSDPSSFMYRGEYPLSEPESKSLANALKKYRDYIKLYISLHCYGNFILYPWGYTKTNIKDKKLVHQCGEQARCAMMCFKDRGFKVGSSANTLYISSGSTMDYARGAMKIKFCYTIELQRYGKSGFTAPPNKIREIGEETCCGIGAMVRFVKNYYTLQQRLRGPVPVRKHVKRMR